MDATVSQEVVRSALRAKVVYTFNQVLLGFIKDLRKNAVIAKIVGKHHKVFDRESSSYLEHFAERYPELIKHVQPGAEFSFATATGAHPIDVIRNVTLHDICSNCKTPQDSAAVDRYVLTLMCIAVAGRDSAAVSADDAHAVFSVMVDKLRQIEHDGKVDLNDVFDDELRMLLECLSSKSEADAAPMSDNVVDELAGAEELLERMQQTKLGEIAKEISQNIDMDKIQTPSDIMNFASSEKLGNMIKTVTSTIQTKISDGTLNTEELFSEAMDMMKHFNNGKGGGLANMFKNGNINKAAVSQLDKSMKTKARLRDKLEKRAGASASTGVR